MRISFGKPLAVAAWAVGTAIAAAEPVVSEDPPVLPTEVEITVLAGDVIRIDGSTQAFMADIFARFSWTDPRLAKPGGGSRRMDLNDVWHPRMLIANQRNADPKLPEVVEVEADGRVSYLQRMLGDFACPMDLAEFPFDRQELHIHVVAAGYDEDEVKFVINHENSGRAEHFSITDWKVGDMRIEPQPYTARHSVRVVPGVSLRFEVTRLARYYAGTIFATVTIIVAMAWLVFWIPPAHINPRMSISVTSMLSLIAYRFVASQDLPRLPYLTTMDFFLLGSAMLVLFGMAAVVLISRRQSHGREQSALRWNKILRWTYPLAFVLMFVAMWLC